MTPNSLVRYMIPFSPVGDEYIYISNKFDQVNITRAILALHITYTTIRYSTIWYDTI